MSIPNYFNKEVSNTILERINSLTPNTQPLWGTMNVSQMLAHCNVTYDMLFTNKYPQPNFLVQTLLKLFVKPTVVGDKPYKKQSQTAPAFIIKDERNFESEKQKLIQNIQRTLELGEAYFEGKASNSFGKLSSKEWNNMFYKHLDHHLSQFGA